LHQGVPVIGSNVSAIPEVVGQAGMLVAPDDVSGMAKALIAVMTDAGLRARLSARALAQAARFSWTKTVKETLAAYEEVLL
jgi:glycosyltransferase involved in cell wall biosynthesis